MRWRRSVAVQTRRSDTFAASMGMDLAGGADPYVSLIEGAGVIGGRYHCPSALPRAAGHFSLLFGADDSTNGKRVALKFFHPAHFADAYRRDSFTREARILADFRGQPNILQLIEGERNFVVQATTVGGVVIPITIPYYVTELAPGSLADYAYSSAANPRDSLVLFREVCKAIQRLHGRDAYHRDAKLQNCLIFPHKVVKLCDFGTVRFTNEPPLRLTYDLPVGDLRYSAIELFCGLGNEAVYLPGADLFSLGAILFELFTRTQLTSLVYDIPQLLQLSQHFTRLPTAAKLTQYATLLPAILTTWKLPSLASLAPVPNCIRDRLERLYATLAALDYRVRRQVTFEWVFREIEIALRILENEDKYRRWALARRNRRMNR